MTLLQITSLHDLPTFKDMVTYYGPYLSLILILTVAICFVQKRGFNKIVKVKDEENKRLIEREQTLNDRIVFMIDKEIGYRRNK
jgi:hypothetical protein